jgi:hypothetical protein
VRNRAQDVVSSELWRLSTNVEHPLQTPDPQAVSVAKPLVCLGEKLVGVPSKRYALWVHQSDQMLQE